MTAVAEGAVPRQALEAAVPNELVSLFRLIRGVEAVYEVAEPLFTCRILLSHLMTYYYHYYYAVCTRSHGLHIPLCG